jgi:hypothetical protein
VFTTTPPEPWSLGGDARVVEHHVEPTEAIDCSLHKLVDVCRASDVTGHGDAGRTGRVKTLDRVCGPIGANVGADDPRAMLCEQQRARAPDTGPRPGDDHDLVGQQLHEVPPEAMTAPRDHKRVDTVQPRRTPPRRSLPALVARQRLLK